MKKILFIANYFYPDVASLGQLITDLCLEMKNSFEVEVIAAIPNYSEQINTTKEQKRNRYYIETVNGIKVYRIVVPNVDKKNKISRIKYILTYFRNTRYVINKFNNYDIIFTVSQPPILGGMLGKYAKRKNKNSKLVYNIQDFNPEQIEAVKFSKIIPLLKFLRFLDNESSKAADKVLVVGSEMLETLKTRNSEFAQKGIVINNWIDEEQIYPLNKENNELLDFKNKYGLKNKFVIMYSGNIGLFYDLQNLVKVAEKFKNNNDIVFALAGDGAIRRELEEYKTSNNLNNIVFIPYQPKDKLNISLNVADVHLVVNAKGIKGVSVPSKIYGILSCGKYIIGVLENGSEARRIIESSNCGRCVDPKDYEGFEHLIYDAYNNRDKLSEFGLNGRKYLVENFTKDISMKKYKKMFNEL